MTTLGLSTSGRPELCPRRTCTRHQQHSDPREQRTLRDNGHRWANKAQARATTSLPISRKCWTQTPWLTRPLTLVRKSLWEASKPQDGLPRVFTGLHEESWSSRGQCHLLVAAPQNPQNHRSDMQKNAPGMQAGVPACSERLVRSPAREQILKLPHRHVCVYMCACACVCVCE